MFGGIPGMLIATGILGVKSYKKEKQKVQNMLPPDQTIDAIWKTAVEREMEQVIEKCTNPEEESNWEKWLEEGSCVYISKPAYVGKYPCYRAVADEMLEDGFTEDELRAAFYLKSSTAFSSYLLAKEGYLHAGLIKRDLIRCDAHLEGHQYVYLRSTLEKNWELLLSFEQKVFELYKKNCKSPDLIPYCYWGSASLDYQGNLERRFFYHVAGDDSPINQKLKDEHKFIYSIYTFKPYSELSRECRKKANMAREEVNNQVYREFWQAVKEAIFCSVIVLILIMIKISMDGWTY